jgi:hypothetical protein
MGFLRAARRLVRLGRRALDLLNDAPPAAAQQQQQQPSVGVPVDGTDGAPPAGAPRRAALPAPFPVPPVGAAPWGVVRGGRGRERASRADLPGGGAALRVDYAAGAVGSASGFGFYAAPAGVFPAEEATLSYRVYFPPDFDWKKGGKLPGLYLGKPGAAGGNWEAAAGSVRVIFKEGGVAAAYCYLPTQVAPCGTAKGAVAAQGPDYAAVAHLTATKGCHVFKGGPLRFAPGSWNAVRLRVRLNSAPGACDGLLELEVNGQGCVCGGLTLRAGGAGAAPRVGGAAVVTFFGGSAKEAAAPEGAFALFADFVAEGR